MRGYDQSFKRKCSRKLKPDLCGMLWLIFRKQLDDHSTQPKYGRSDSAFDLRHSAGYGGSFCRLSAAGYEKSAFLSVVCQFMQCSWFILFWIWRCFLGFVHFLLGRLVLFYLHVFKFIYRTFGNSGQFAPGSKYGESFLPPSKNTEGINPLYIRNFAMIIGSKGENTNG